MLPGAKLQILNCMTLRVFLLSTLVGTMLGWLVVAAILLWLDPVQAGAVGFGLFFLSLFVAATSTTALIGFFIRRLLMRSRHPAHNVRSSLRQGIWLGLFLDFLLVLQLFRFARWWLTLIVIMFFVTLEFIFLSHARSPRSTEEGS